VVSLPRVIRNSTLTAKVANNRIISNNLGSPSVVTGILSSSEFTVSSLDFVLLFDDFLMNFASGT
jgi:hypothetical protein